MTDAPANPKSFEERDHWMRAVLKSELPPVAVHVALVIGFHLKVKTGRCYPGIDDIITASHVPERSLYRQITLLEDAGWLSIKRVRRPGQHNEYTLVYPATAMAGNKPDTAMAGKKSATCQSYGRGDLPKHPQRPATTVAGQNKRQAKIQAKEEYIGDPPDFASPDSKQDAGAKAGQKREPKASDQRTNVDKKVDIHIDPAAVADLDADQAGETHDNKKNDVKGLAPDDLAALFAEFWAACPRKVAEEKSRKAFVAAVKRGVDPGKIVAAMQRYAVAVARAGKKPEHIKLPANWLADGYYDEASSAPRTIDHETGEEIVEPARPSRPKTIDEIADEMLAEFRGKP